MAAKRSKRVKPALRIEQPAETMLGELLSLTVGLLLVVRMLVPTESAEDGSTLWIVQLWLAAGLVWAWNAIRERDDRIRWDRLDVAFLEPDDNRAAPLLALNDVIEKIAIRAPVLFATLLLSSSN